MSIETIAIQKAVDDAFSRLGEDIIYTADGEDAVTVSAIDVNRQEPDKGTQSLVDVRKIKVKAGDVPSPTYRDRFEIDGLSWYYHQTEEQSGYTKVLVLNRKERPKFRG